MTRTLRILWPAVVTTLTLSSALGMGVRTILERRASALVPVVPQNVPTATPALPSLPTDIPLDLDDAPGMEVAKKKATPPEWDDRLSEKNDQAIAILREEQADLDAKTVELNRAILQLREDMVKRAGILEEALRRMDEALKRVDEAEDQAREAGRLSAESEKKSVEIQSIIESQSGWKKALDERVVRLEAALKTREANEQAANQSAKRMVKMYVNMSPEKAAGILREQSDAAVAEILGRMKEAEAARILVMFPAKRAATLATRLNAGRTGTP
jgi:flagellar motility protein MotE (MotC chaperone)